MQANKNYAMNAKEISSFKSLVNTVKNINHYHATKFSEEEYDVIKKLIAWPLSERFPREN